jgi:hypothetical protein
MWTYTTEKLEEGRFRFSIMETKGKYLSFKEVFVLWKESEAFRTFYNTILVDTALLAFFWEHPPITKSTQNEAYEFILTNSPHHLNVKADIQPFQGHFKQNESVISFWNLGRDALLIVPCSIVVLDSYAHLSVFVRNAPQKQIDLFWKIVGTKCLEEIKEQAIWLSTAGLGVFWLHIRLDSYPKYYRYLPYKKNL